MTLAAGPPYLVGDKGPEIFVPQTRGYLIGGRDLAKGASVDDLIDNIDEVLDRYQEGDE